MDTNDTDPWREPDPEFTLSDWKWAVCNNDTRNGYWDWVASNREANQEDNQ